MANPIQLRERASYSYCARSRRQQTNPSRKKNFHRVENVIKQLVHTSAVCSSRYEARGKFGEHERCVKVARGVAESNSSFLSFKSSFLRTLTYEPIVNWGKPARTRTAQLLSVSCTRLVQVRSGESNFSPD